VPSKKLFLSSTVLFVLVSLLFVGSVGASLEMWSQTYGGAGEDVAYSLVETSDGGYSIAGATNGNVLLVKTDEQGNLEWNHTYGGGRAYSLVKTSDGGYAIAGYTNSFSSEGTDFWLIKTDEYGNMEWNKTYGEGTARSLVETSDRGYALVGNTRLVKTDEFGNMEWNKTYGEGSLCSLVELSDVGYAIAGTTKSFDASSDDFWLIKTDEYGNMEWNKTYGRVDAEWIRITGEVHDNAYSLVETSDGGYALTGDTSPHLLGSPRDVWLVKTDAYGNMEWNRTYGGESYEDAYSLVETSDGGFAIAGCTRSFGAGFEDFWLVKTDEYGNLEWNRTYGGEEWERARSLIETSDGGFALAGYTDSFGAEGYDFWLVKTDAQGIPEFPSWIILPLVLTVTTVVTIYKKRLPKNC